MIKLDKFINRYFVWLIVVLVIIFVLDMNETYRKNETNNAINTEITSSEMTEDIIEVEESTEESKIEEENIIETVEDSEIPISREIPEEYIINDINCILQYPELPTGCEATALDIVLQYYGNNIDKCDLADNYLPKCEVGTDFPYNAFLGNPRNSHSYGCYAPVIVQTANNYFDSNNITGYNVTDVSGALLEDLYEFICRDIPVIIWATMYMGEVHNTTTWNINGENFTWKANEHCMVLYGYNKNDNTLFILDPLVGATKYNKTIFEDRFVKMGKQAVIINHL